MADPAGSSLCPVLEFVRSMTLWLCQTFQAMSQGEFAIDLHRTHHHPKKWLDGAGRWRFACWPSNPHPLELSSSRSCRTIFDRGLVWWRFVLIRQEGPISWVVPTRRDKLTQCKDAYTAKCAYKTRVSITIASGYTVFCTLYNERYTGTGIYGFSYILKARGYSSISFLKWHVSLGRIWP